MLNRWVLVFCSSFFFLPQFAWAQADDSSHCQKALSAKERIQNLSVGTWISFEVAYGHQDPAPRIGKIVRKNDFFLELNGTHSGQNTRKFFYNHLVRDSITPIPPPENVLKGLLFGDLVSFYLRSSQPNPDPPVHLAGTVLRRNADGFWIRPALIPGSSQKQYIHFSDVDLFQPFQKIMPGDWIALTPSGLMITPTSSAKPTHHLTRMDGPYFWGQILDFDLEVLRIRPTAVAQTKRYFLSLGIQPQVIKTLSIAPPGQIETISLRGWVDETATPHAWYPRLEWEDLHLGDKVSFYWQAQGRILDGCIGDIDPETQAFTLDFSEDDGTLHSIEFSRTFVEAGHLRGSTLK